MQINMLTVEEASHSLTAQNAMMNVSAGCMSAKSQSIDGKQYHAC